MQTWETTRLWHELARSAPKLTEARMRLYLTDAEATLAKVHTAPADFTLHDEEHGFRVAERMAAIIGAERLGQLSAVEAALLLSAAYLHDIGMSPNRHTLRCHRDYLISGDRALLTENEREKLQSWLDDSADGVVPPLVTETPDAATLARVDGLLAHYCRSRHNDWSETWIREYVTGNDREIYPGFTDDLVLLCRSHHDGYEELIGSAYDPKLVAADIVHMRFLAAVLRLADILEFDPKRTPNVVFRQRDVAASSVVYWYKDHEVSFRGDNNHFIFYARPRTAALLHALSQMADDVDRELQVCARLAKEGRFQLAPLSAGSDPRYEWRFEPILKRDVHPKAGIFEEFDGVFKPNVERLLSLLAGKHLYGEPILAVRELIQNAFDAVREQIARERLADLDRFGTADERTIAGRHFVMIELRSAGSEWEFECTDSGVGMTRDIIRNRFLASGSAAGHRELDLERRCLERGFSIGRTGQFGIGVLSYFMLADRLELITCRRPDVGDSDGAWSFSVRGLDDAGELRRVEHPSPGTTVILRLRGDAMPKGPEDFAQELRHRVISILRRVPCRVMVRNHRGETMFESPPGWTSSADELIQLRGELYEYEKRETRSLATEEFSERKRRFRVDVEEGEIPGAAGHYRINLPWFELDVGASRTFFSAKKRFGRIIIQHQWRFDKGYQSSAPRMSWKGIEIHDGLEGTVIGYSGLIEIDLTGPGLGVLDVSRSTFKLNDLGWDAHRFVVGRWRVLMRQWLERHKASPFWAHDCRFCGQHAMEPPPHRYWTFPLGDGKYELRKIILPVTTTSSPSEHSVVVDGVETKSLAPFGGDGEEWFDHEAYPTDIAVEGSDRAKVLPVWRHDRNREPRVAMPPEWCLVIAVNINVDLRRRTIYNAAHPLITALGPEPPWLRIDDVHQCRYRSEQELPTDRREARILLLQYAIIAHQWDYWDRLTPEHRGALWEIAFAGGIEMADPLLHLASDVLVEVSVEGARLIPIASMTKPMLDAYLPLPDAKWLYRVL